MLNAGTRFHADVSVINLDSCRLILKDNIREGGLTIFARQHLFAIRHLCERPS